MYKFAKADKNGLYNISQTRTVEEVVLENGGNKNNASTAKAWVCGGTFAEGSVAKDVADQLLDLAQNNADINGVMFAVEKKFENKTKLGIGYQYDNSNVASKNRHLDIGTNTGFIYGEYKPSVSFVQGTLSYDRASYKENRYTLGSIYKAKYNVDIYSLQTVTGYDLKQNRWTITPDGKS